MTGLFTTNFVSYLPVFVHAIHIHSKIHHHHLRIFSLFSALFTDHFFLKMLLNRVFFKKKIKKLLINNLHYNTYVMCPFCLYIYIYIDW
jgi:hypothetical protein